MAAKNDDTAETAAMMQAAFAVLVSIDRLETAGELEAGRLSKTDRVRKMYERLLSSRDDLAEQLQAVAQKRGEGR